MSPVEPTFIAIGISITLEKIFDYKIPKIILVRKEKELPSLLRGYEIVEAVGNHDIKRKLNALMPNMIRLIKKTIWKPRILPFFENVFIYQDSCESFESYSDYQAKENQVFGDVAARKIIGLVFRDFPKIHEYSELSLESSEGKLSAKLIELRQLIDDRLINNRLKEEEAQIPKNISLRNIGHKKYFESLVNSLQVLLENDLEFAAKVNLLFSNIRLAIEIQKQDELVERNEQQYDLTALNKQLTVLEGFVEALDHGKEAARWLDAHRITLAKTAGEYAINKFPEIKKKASLNQIDDFHFSLEQFLEQFSHCLTWGMPNILDSPGIPLSFDVRVYTAILIMANDYSTG